MQNEKLFLPSIEQRICHRLKDLLQQSKGVLDSSSVGASFPMAMAVGVSGGSDSLALCLILKQWCITQGIILHPIVIDHQLRPESTQEAVWVQRCLWHRYQLPSCRIDQKAMFVLNGQGCVEDPLPQSLQKEALDPSCTGMHRARIYRYHRFLYYCQRHRITHLILGHHFDDWLETIAMRKESSHHLWSGAGFAPLYPMGSFWIVRPMIQEFKKDLENFLRARKQEWVQDPSNVCVAYRRIFWRKKQESWTLEQKMAYGKQAENLLNLRKKERDLMASKLKWVKTAEGFWIFAPKKNFFQDFLSLSPEQGGRWLRIWTQGFYQDWLYQGYPDFLKLKGEVTPNMENFPSPWQRSGPKKKSYERLWQVIKTTLKDPMLWENAKSEKILWFGSLNHTRIGFELKNQGFVFHPDPRCFKNLSKNSISKKFFKRFIPFSLTGEIRLNDRMFPPWG